MLNKESTSKIVAVNRRQFLGTAALGGMAFGVGGLLNFAATPVEAQATKRPSTPPLSAADIAAIETAIGKKGTYVEAEGVYTVPLPRADLKVSIKDAAVLIQLSQSHP